MTTVDDILTFFGLQAGTRRTVHLRDGDELTGTIEAALASPTEPLGLRLHTGSDVVTIPWHAVLLLSDPPAWLFPEERTS